MTFFLYALTGPVAGSRWEVSEKLVIGRDSGCDVPIPDPAISRRHCVLTPSAHGVELEDLGAQNVTLVNGQVRPKAQLTTGDRFALGHSLFTIGVSRTTQEDEDRDEHASTVSVSVLSSIGPYAGSGTGIYADAQSDRNAFSALFSLGYELNRANTFHDAIAIASRHLEQAFLADHVFVLKPAPEGFRPWRDEPNIQPSEVETDLARKAVDLSEGVIELTKQSADGGRIPMYTLAAPLSVGRRNLGAVVVQTPLSKKPCDESDLKFLLAAAYVVAPVLAALQDRTASLGLGAQSEFDCPEFIGSSAGAEQVRRLIDQTAFTDLSILITGETGTGKEVVARMCHAASHRASGPFVVVNCAAIPGELIASELFGHERGAFTGAVSERTGRIEAADGGTLFLDEIGDLSLDLQAGLLRVLDTRTFERVGSNTSRQADFRIIAATHLDLEDAVETEAFRRDLYHRIGGVRIHIPPLQRRPEDIADLSRYFFERIRSEFSGGPQALSDDAVELLCGRPWPGNVRELRYCIQSTYHLARSPILSASDFEDYFRLTPVHPSSRDNGVDRTLAAMERRHILEVVDENAGNLKAAATSLGLARSTLYKRLKEFGIGQ